MVGREKRYLPFEMPKAQLYRWAHLSDCTLGLLVLGSDRWYTLEPPWADNQRNKSAIPVGTYEAGFLKQSASGRYRDVFYLQDVEGRSGILIHPGNTARETQGCILVGKRLGRLSGRPAVLNSRSALKALVEATDQRDFSITVTGVPIHDQSS